MPANISVDAVAVTKQAKTDKANTHQQLKLGNYASTLRAFVKYAQSLYRCAISCIDAFPDHKTETDFACDAWVDACNALKVTAELDPDSHKLVCDLAYVN